MSSAYLLYWEKHTKPPQTLLVHVTSTRQTESGIYVEFEFLEGPERGMRSCAPLAIIITEKEKNIVEAANNEIALRRQQAKQIEAEARGIFETVITNHLAAIRAANFQDPTR